MPKIADTYPGAETIMIIAVTVNNNSAFLNMLQPRFFNYGGVCRYEMYLKVWQPRSCRNAGTSGGQNAARVLLWAVNEHTV